jgi:hypothetical protein
MLLLNQARTFSNLGRSTLRACLATKATFFCRLQMRSGTCVYVPERTQDAAVPDSYVRGNHQYACCLSLVRLQRYCCVSMKLSGA